MRRPYALKNGVTSFPGFYVSTDYASSLGATPQFPAPPNDMLLGAMAGLGDAIQRNFVLQDPAAYSLSFDPLAPGDKLSRVLAVSNIMDATSTDIQPFINKGGKRILVHGLSDQLIPFAGSVRRGRSTRAQATSIRPLATIAHPVNGRCRGARPVPEEGTGEGGQLRWGERACSSQADDQLSYLNDRETRAR